jgi:hypothetical protein
MRNSSYDDSAKLVENQTFGAYSNLFDSHISHDDFHIFDSGSADASIFACLRFNRPSFISLVSHLACYLTNTRSPPLDNMAITHCISRCSFLA